MKKNSIFSLFILCSFFLFSCQKEITGDLTGSGSGGGGNNSGGATSSYPYYFIATVNGANIKYEADDLSSTYSCGTSQPENSTGYTDYDIYEGTVIANPLDLSKSNISVHILKYFNHDPTAAERAAMIKIGSYGYGVGNVNSTTVNGASITYVDANGDNWFSETGSQTGSTFSIAELVDNTNGTSAKIFKAIFSCKLYDLNGTKSIQVTNATIRGKILSP